jgi:hypothetical protein
MQILQHQRKGPHLNALERFYINKTAARDNHLNDKHTVLPNKIFEVILKIQLPPTNPSPQLHDRKQKTDQPSSTRNAVSSGVAGCRTDTSASAKVQQCEHRINDTRNKTSNSGRTPPPAQHQCHGEVQDKRDQTTTFHKNVSKI